MRQFNSIYKMCNNTFKAIQFQVVRRHASRRDESFYAQVLPVKTAQFTQFFPSGMTSHSKIAQFN